MRNIDFLLVTTLTKILRESYLVYHTILLRFRNATKQQRLLMCYYRSGDICFSTGSPPIRKCKRWSREHRKSKLQVPIVNINLNNVTYSQMQK